MSASARPWFILGQHTTSVMTFFSVRDVTATRNLHFASARINLTRGLVKL